MILPMKSRKQKFRVAQRLFLHIFSDYSPDELGEIGKEKKRKENREKQTQ